MAEKGAVAFVCVLELLLCGVLVEARINPISD